jgi:hypothetical protein
VSFLLLRLPGDMGRTATVTSILIIYGATVAASRMGKTALLIQTGSHFGGLTTSGFSNTDKGDESTIGGLARRFIKIPAGITK